ncbi:MAG TPA: hypothetical protein VGN81_01285 [Pseudonocardiaceae bacterium]
MRARLAKLGFPEEAHCAQIAENLIAECGIRPRTAWRLACELSLEAVATRYNTITDEPAAGMRGSRVWEYEQWPERGVRPTVRTLGILAQIYGTTWRALLTVHDLEQLPPKELAQYHAVDAQGVGGVVEAGAVHGGVLQVGAAQPGAVPVGSDTLAEAMLLTAANGDEVQLDVLWSELDYLSDAYTRASPDSVLRWLSVVQRRAATLSKGRQPLKGTRELYLINAKSLAMMAWIAGDLGRYRDAQQLNAAAWLYTQSADDTLARRWVRSTQARVAFWAGNGIESARLAADALQYRVGGLNDAPLILAEARGWSSVRAKLQVMDAIDRWSRIEDAGSEAATGDKFFNITKDRRHYMAGTSLLSVGQTAHALREFQAARQAYNGMTLDQRWAAMEPMIRIDAARAHLDLGDLDTAAAEVEPLLSADVSRQPDMVRSMLGVLAKELTGTRWSMATAAKSLADALISARGSNHQ